MQAYPTMIEKKKKFSPSTNTHIIQPLSIWNYYMSHGDSPLL